MALDINDNIEPYKEFYGRNTEQMPLLIAEGRTPLSVAGVMERRLNSGKQDWRDNYFDTGDAIIYHPDRKVKIVLDAQPLRSLTSESNLRNGSLILPYGMYEDLQGEEFAYKDVEKLVGRQLSQDEAPQHPIWRAVARDSELLKEYAPKMFREMKERFGYNENMGVYLDSFDNAPKLRALFVGGLEDWSWLFGVSSLDDVCGRLVGVAPEALNAPGKVIAKPSLEIALNVVNEHIGTSGIVLRKR